jgi:2-polyprenyl-6-methoxyphenol hydroxylase-like FAD-dependent oxidoreductase
VVTGGPARRRVLISGLGIAGATLGWWLAEYGFDVTIVERASGLRQGGYMIDFWGLGYDVAEGMGLVEGLRACGYAIDELRLVRANGDRLATIGARAVRAALGERFFSIMRGDLAGALYRQARTRVAIMFDDRIRAIDAWDGGVDVAFARAPDDTFDIVVGADGAHSPTRREVCASQCEQPLGLWTAAFSIRGYTHRDPGAYVSFTEVGRQVARYALRDNRTAFLLIFREKDAPAGTPPTPAALATLLRTEYGTAWECPAILAALERAEDPYFDIVSQVHAPKWSSGRVVLVGDAAYCPSLLAGEGASLAMAGAYILAGELDRCAGDHTVAFERYEQRLRPLIERKQKGALRLGGWFAPRTTAGLLARNVLTRLAGFPSLAPFIVKDMLESGLEWPTYRSRRLGETGRSHSDRRHRSF